MAEQQDIHKQMLLEFGRLSVQVRWVFVGVAIAGWPLATAQGWLPNSAIPLACVILFIALYNALTHMVLRRWRKGGDLASLAAVEMLRQTNKVTDLLAFGAILYLTGTLESPLFAVFLLAFVFLGLVASSTEFIVTASVVFAGVTVLALGELYGVFPHFHAGIPVQTEFYRQPSFVAGTLMLWAGLFASVQGLVLLIRRVLDRREHMLARQRRELRQIQAFQGEVLEQLPIGVVVFGQGGQIQAANSAARQFLQLDRDEHRNLLKLGAIEAAGLTSYIEQLLAGEPLLLIDLPLPAANNSEKRWYKLNGVPASSEQSGILLIDDISDAKRREQQERKIKERLAQADKFSSLGQMASGVAHELNNPLTAIQSAAQYLQFITREQRLTPDEVLDKSDLIVTHGERIAQLIKGLLAYAKPSGAEHQRLNVARVLDELLSFSAFELRRSNIEVEKHVEAVPDFLAAKVDLQQMLLNLINNARQAMAPLGGGRIRLRITTQQQSGRQWLRLEVADNGPGIPAEIRPRIFEPFFTTKSEDEGTGLGLAIVHALVERYEGRIQVQTEVGQGTLFIIDLPYLDQVPDWDPTGDQTFSPYR